MASGFKNRGEAEKITFEAADTNIKPATFSAGDPVVVGDRPGVAMTDRDATSTRATIWFYGSYDNVLVTATAAAGIGTRLFFQNTASDGTHLTTTSRNNTRWGYTSQAIPSGASRARVVVGY